MHDGQLTGFKKIQDPCLPEQSLFVIAPTPVRRQKREQKCPTHHTNTFGKEAARSPEAQSAPPKEPKPEDKPHQCCKKRNRVKRSECCHAKKRQLIEALANISFACCDQNNDARPQERKTTQQIFFTEIKTNNAFLGDEHINEVKPREERTFHHKELTLAEPGKSTDDSFTSGFPERELSRSILPKKHLREPRALNRKELALDTQLNLNIPARLTRPNNSPSTIPLVGDLASECPWLNGAKYYRYEANFKAGFSGRQDRVVLEGTEIKTISGIKKRKNCWESDSQTGFISTTCIAAIREMVCPRLDDGGDDAKCYRTSDKPSIKKSSHNECSEKCLKKCADQEAAKLKKCMKQKVKISEKESKEKQKVAQQREKEKAKYCKKNPEQCKQINVLMEKIDRLESCLEKMKAKGECCVENPTSSQIDMNQVVNALKAEIRSQLDKCGEKSSTCAGGGAEDADDLCTLMEKMLECKKQQDIEEQKAKMKAEVRAKIQAAKDAVRDLQAKTQEAKAACKEFSRKKKCLKECSKSEICRSESESDDESFGCKDLDKLISETAKENNGCFAKEQTEKGQRDKKTEQEQKQNRKKESQRKSLSCKDRCRGKAEGKACSSSSPKKDECKGILDPKKSGESLSSKDQGRGKAEGKACTSASPKKDECKGILDPKKSGESLSNKDQGRGKAEGLCTSGSPKKDECKGSFDKEDRGNSDLSNRYDSEECQDEDASPVQADIEIRLSRGNRPS